MAPPTVLQERRRSPRSEVTPRWAINLLKPEGVVAANSVNFSRGGLCLRLQERLEVRSLVKLQLTANRLRTTKTGRPVQCTGRVAWVIQRLDLRDAPPFLFDVGIEFVDPPATLRQALARRGGALTSLKGRPVSHKLLESATIRSRCFIPRLEAVVNHPLRWHLVVSVDGVPCFSGHYPSEREATSAWTQFKRRQMKGRKSSAG